MADDLDPGIDKQKLLDEIVGASSVEATAPPPAAVPAPVLPPAPPVPKRAPAPVPGAPAPKPGGPAAKTASAAGPAPVVVLPPPPPAKKSPGMLRFRHEAAALILGFCGVIWGAVGIGTRAWLPGGLGALLLVAGLGAWTWSLWREEE